MPRHPRPAVPAWVTPWIDSFALSLRANRRSPRTIEMYIDVVRWFGGWLPSEIDDWSEVTIDHVRRFFVHLQDLEYSASYVNNVGRCLQAFWRWYSVEEDQPNIFGDRLKPPPPPKLGDTPPPVIAAEQLALLLKDAEARRDFEGRRDAAIIRLFAATGGRLAELALLQVDAVDLGQRQATVTGKGAKTRIVRFDNQAALALDRYLRVRARHKAVTELGVTALWIGTRRRSGMTPSGIRRMIYRRAKRLGLKVWPHLFRHTFAHQWLDRGGAEGDLMELAGWGSPQMLRHYGASARGARARRAYDRVMGEMPG
ncbi:tyrosine-type recombinase/integrase [Solwaraspora sp. WMMD1047]|uniref:tyrosine-type recombinase/integrase n=1 Tax=Solwaraspora sp. WMMD1047 TaxID=3016102 RepID=UPI002415F5BD|nr:tyrosine-type recombinase/integrase [Solwaraspora sp. WMMD1047]MDG4832448.1 tyrosine-type recombinase/integrase [Solwaraspora sp. WMMD1047]